MLVPTITMLIRRNPRNIHKGFIYSCTETYSMYTVVTITQATRCLRGCASTVRLCKCIVSQSAPQTPSTGLRHPSFGGRCRKAMLGVCLHPSHTPFLHPQHVILTPTPLLRPHSHSQPSPVVSIIDNMDFLTRKKSI